jgi:hypothetical protein
MNRIVPRLFNRAAAAIASQSCRRTTARLRDEADAMLRDIAYVLQLTRRVRNEILEENRAEAALGSLPS